MIFLSLTFARSLRTLRMLMNDKIMFDRYYCINSIKHSKNEENIGALQHIFLCEYTFKNMHVSGQCQELII